MKSSAWLGALCLLGQGAALEDGAALAQARVRAVRGSRPPDMTTRTFRDAEEYERRLRRKMELDPSFAALKGALEGRPEFPAPVLLAALPRSRAASRLDTSHGIFFNRTSAVLEPSTSMTLQADHGCTQQDALGSSNCTLAAGDTVPVSYRWSTARPIGRGSRMALRLRTKLVGVPAVVLSSVDEARSGRRFVKRLPEVNLTCPVCEGLCEASVFGFRVRRQMAACREERSGEGHFELRVPSFQALRLVQSRWDGELALLDIDGSQRAKIAFDVLVGPTSEKPCPGLKRLLGKCDD